MNAACGGFSAPSCSREEGMLLGVVAAVGQGIHRIWRRIATSVCLAHTIMKLRQSQHAFAKRELSPRGEQWRRLRVVSIVVDCAPE